MNLRIAHQANPKSAAIAFALACALLGGDQTHAIAAERERLFEAVAARVPKESFKWACVRYRQGTSKVFRWNLDADDDNVTLFKDAVTFFEDADKVFSDDGGYIYVINLWALASTWGMIADRGDNADHLHAIDAYEQAIRQVPRDSFPEYWAQLNWNLADEWLRLEIRDRKENLQLALSHCESAMTIFTKWEYPDEYKELSEMQQSILDALAAQ